MFGEQQSRRNKLKLVPCQVNAIALSFLRVAAIDRKSIVVPTTRSPLSYGAPAIFPLHTTCGQLCFTPFTPPIARGSCTSCAQPLARGLQGREKAHLECLTAPVLWGLSWDGPFWRGTATPAWCSWGPWLNGSQLRAKHLNCRKYGKQV